MFTDDIESQLSEVFPNSKLEVQYSLSYCQGDGYCDPTGTIPEDLASQLYSNTQIIAFNNYDNGQGYVPIDATTVSGNTVKAEKAEILPEAKSDVSEEGTCEEVVTYNTSDATEEPKFVLRYPKVKRAEVYLCDFGETREHEQGGKRYAIIIQNDSGNEHSPNTIVLPCTTQHKANLPVHYIFRFSSENMVDCSN